MGKRFQDQVVMITGAASGFGKMAAERFAEEGARLGLSDISAEKLESVADGLRGQGVEVVSDVVDVSNAEQVAAHVDQYRGGLWHGECWYQQCRNGA